MKWIKYHLNNPVNTGTADTPVWTDNLFKKTIPYSEANLAVAVNEAFDGTYTIEETEDSPNALSIEERIAALEKTVLPVEFTAGSWYYRGDKVSFEDGIYTCIAPAGAVCVWSPADYPAYWQKV